VAQEEQGGDSGDQEDHRAQRAPGQSPAQGQNEKLDRERQKGAATLQPGEITFSVMARTETNEPGRRIHSSIGLARPSDRSMYGYISEHHGYGMTLEQSGDYAEDLAASMLASTLGIEFDSDAAWNERKRVYETSNLIIGSTSITAYAEGDAGGRWTCAVAAAVFRFP
jgi:arginine decarboxylase